MATQDDLGTEKVPETSSGMAGCYNAVMGKTYKNIPKPGKRGGILTDFFLVSRTAEDGSVVHPIMDYRNSKATFLKAKDQTLKTDGILVRHNCNELVPGDPERTANFMIQIRKKFARQLGAYDEATGSINWSKIQGMAGVLVSFNLVERNDYLNIDTKTIQPYEQEKISPENLEELYTVINAEIEKRKAAKAAKAPAPQTAPPPPQDDPPF